MNIFDFVTQEELDDLPEDPNLAFATFVRHALRRLADRTQELEHEASWNLLEDARHGFMNVVIAAGKRYGIEPFASMEVPRLADFNNNVHRQFRADLDHYMTQLLLDNSIRGKQDSVIIEPKTKDRIRNYLHNLKTCVENATLPEAKKAALLNKLAEFEAELEKRRLSLLAVARVTLEILALPGAVWASAEIAHKLMTNVLQTVHQAKVEEDEARRLPPVMPPAALSPPRTEKPHIQASSSLNDDIPF